MPDLTTILANIRQNVVSVPSDTEARLVGFVNEAQRKLEAAHQWMALETEWVAITVEGVNRLRDFTTPTLYKPAGWVMAIGDPWYRAGETGDTMPLEWIPGIEDARSIHPQYTATSAKGPPRGLLETASQISVYPKPDAENPLGTYSSAGEYEIIVPYRKREAVLSAGGTTTNAFTTDPSFQLFLENYASGKAMLFNRDIANGQLSLQQAQDDLVTMKRTDKQRKGQFLKITPRRDVHASRHQRRAV